MDFFVIWRSAWDRFFSPSLTNSFPFLLKIRYFFMLPATTFTFCPTLACKILLSCFFHPHMHSAILNFSCVGFCRSQMIRTFIIWPRQAIVKDWIPLLPTETTFTSSAWNNAYMLSRAGTIHRCTTNREMIQHRFWDFPNALWFLWNRFWA